MARDASDENLSQYLTPYAKCAQLLPRKDRVAGTSLYTKWTSYNIAEEEQRGQEHSGECLLSGDERCSFARDVNGLCSFWTSYPTGPTRDAKARTRIASLAPRHRVGIREARGVWESISHCGHDRSELFIEGALGIFALVSSQPAPSPN